MALLFLSLCLASLLQRSSAASLIINIPPSVHLPNPNSLSAYTSATLLSGIPSIPPITVPLTTRSTLEFHDLPAPNTPSSISQSYLLSISSPSHVFSSYRVDISTDINSDAPIIQGVWETMAGSEWSEKGPILGGVGAGAGAKVVAADGAADPDQGAHETANMHKAAGTKHHHHHQQQQQQQQIVIFSAQVLSQRNFYEERPGFNPLSLLMNPMVLLGGVAMIITFGMPYLMDNIDPELRAEFEETKKANPIANIFQQAADSATAVAGGEGGGGDGGGAGGGGGFDLASWMAGSKKSGSGVQGGGNGNGGGGGGGGSVSKRK